VSPAVVLGNGFHILVTLASIDLVFDAEVRQVHMVVEIREVVLPCPGLNFARSRVGRPSPSGRSRLRSCRNF
jgi:hypothetical protein